MRRVVLRIQPVEVALVDDDGEKDGAVARHRHQRIYVQSVGLKIKPNKQTSKNAHMAEKKPKKKIGYLATGRSR